MNKITRIGVACVVLRDGKILLGKRLGAHGVGTWATPGGHLEFGEQISNCAARELREETALIADQMKHLDYVENIMEGKHYITFFVQVDVSDGDPELLEPEKCERWQWFPIDKLPTPLFETIPLFLKKKALAEENLDKSSKDLQASDF